MTTVQQEQQEKDKAIRGNIRELYSRADHDKHNLVSVEDNRIIEYLQESNKLVEQVKRPRDAAVESEGFGKLTTRGVEYFDRLKQDGSFTAGDFIRRLKTRHVSDTDAQAAGAEDPEAFHWAQLGQLPCVAVLFRSVPVVHHMLGPMDAAPRQRRQVQRQARQRAPLGEAVRPEEIDDLEDTEKQETDRNYSEMWKVLLEHNDRLPLLDLVMNHSSFAQTVENLFTLSFMVRDSKVSLEEDEERGMVVVHRAAIKADPTDKNEAARMQFVIPLDIETWELWKKACDGSKPPMLKHRKEWRQGTPQQQQERQDEAAAAAAEQLQQQQQQQEQQQQQQQQAAEEEVEEVQVEEIKEQRPSQRRRKSRAQEQHQEPPPQQVLRQANQQQVSREPEQQAVKEEPRAGGAAGGAGAATTAIEVIDLVTSSDEASPPARQQKRARQAQHCQSYLDQPRRKLKQTARMTH